jgi:hypothetical protein
MRLLRLLFPVLLLGACVRQLPPEPASAVLYRDLQRLVTVEAAAGWKIDRLEVDSMLPEALMSVCHVPPAQRFALMRWLDGRIAAQGGPVEDAFVHSGGDLDAIADLLETTRIHLTLRRALEVADQDCPFWIVPSDDFGGRQISDDRWQLSFGGGGKGIFVYQDDQADIYFGGAGRLLVGRNLGDRWALYVGAEGGASASFPKDETGDRGALVLGLDLVIPAVVRYRIVNTYLELEAGYLARVTEDDLYDFEDGIHVGVAVGGRATRQRWFFPGAALAVSYERTFPDGEDLQLQTIKVGFRVAIDMDL